MPLVAQSAPDVLTFTNGDKLTGKITKGTGGSVTFHTDMAGDQAVDLAKIKSASSTTNFVLIRKVKKTVARVRDLETVTGKIKITDGKLTITPDQGAPETVAAGDIAFIIDQPTFEKQVHQKTPLWKGWTGPLTAGFSSVQSTQTSITFTGAAALVRTMPSLPYIATRNRTLVNVSETYGKQTTPTIPPTTPATPDTIVKTNLFHADAERDQYLPERNLYMLGTLSYDHNYSSGLNLQQIYGGGIGWTPIKTAKQTLDLKGDVHFEMQQFIANSGEPDVHLFGSTFSEAWTYNLPKKMVFTESGNYIPGWTENSVYSANATAMLTLPVWKQLAASVSGTDSYISNPAQYYKPNTYTVTFGVTYTVK